MTKNVGQYLLDLDRQKCSDIFFTVVNLRFRLAVNSHSDHKFDDELLYGFFHLIFRVWIPCSN